MIGITHDSSELRRLITENPGLPVIVSAGDCANTGEYGWEYCSKVYCEINSILDCETPFGGDRIFSGDDKEEFEEMLLNWLYDNLSESIDLADKKQREKFDRLFQDELTKYEPYWKKVIMISVDN